MTNNDYMSTTMDYHDTTMSHFFTNLNSSIQEDFFLPPQVSTQDSATAMSSTLNDLHEGSFSFGLNNNFNLADKNHQNQHCRLFKQFDVIGKIGSGDFADVYEVKSRIDGQYYAIKRTSIPFTSSSDRLRKLQEVRNHQLLPPHPNCVRYYDSWEEDGYLYIQTELCKTSLNGVLEQSEEHKLPERAIWNILLDLLQAIKHLHDHDLIHMDIKPDNIFISFDGIAKLGDFGLMCSSLDLNKSFLSNIPASASKSKSFSKLASSRLSNNDGDVICPNNNNNNLSVRLFDDDDDILVASGSDDGHESLLFDSTSFSHQLPMNHDDSEIINRSDESTDSIDEGDSKYLASETMQGKFTKAADIFSLGISIFEVASGLELPKQGKVYHKLRHNEIEDLYFNGLSADLVKVIKLMMEEDYTKRPTIDDLLQLDIRQIQSRKSILLS